MWMLVALARAAPAEEAEVLSLCAQQRNRVHRCASGAPLWDTPATLVWRNKVTVSRERSKVVSGGFTIDSGVGNGPHSNDNGVNHCGRLG